MANLTDQAKKSKPEHSLIEVMEFCKAHNLPARVVGRWVWIKFKDKPIATIRQALKDFGFRWSRRRSQWCHSCGHRSKPAFTYRPWDRYKTTTLEDYVNAGLGVA